METLLKIWQITLTSNLFNFILMLIFLGWVIKKFNLADLLEQGRKHIEDNILKAKLEKENAEKVLIQTKSETKNVEEEGKQIIKQSEENAVLVGENLIETAEKQTETYSKNAEKTINDTIKNLRKNLTNETAEKAINLAKEHIKKLLENNKELQLKYITESMDTLKEIGL